MRYEERQHASPRAYAGLAGFALALGVLVYAGFVVAGVLRGHVVLTPASAALCLCCFLWFVPAPLWWRAWIRIDERALQVGRERILLTDVESVRPASRRECWQIRLHQADEMLAADPVVMGGKIALMRNEARGMRWQPWNREAVLVSTPHRSTARWLIGCDDAHRLSGALSDAVAAAATDSRAWDAAVGGREAEVDALDRGGWLPGRS